MRHPAPSLRTRVLPETKLPQPTCPRKSTCSVTTGRRSTRSRTASPSSVAVTCSMWPLCCANLRCQPRDPGLGSFHTIRRSARGSVDNLKQALSDALPTLSERRTSARKQTCPRRLPFPPFSLAPGLHAFARSAEPTGFLARKRPRSHRRGTPDVSQPRRPKRLERCKIVSHFRCHCRERPALSLALALP